MLQDARAWRGFGVNGGNGTNLMGKPKVKIRLFKSEE